MTNCIRANWWRGDVAHRSANGPGNWETVCQLLWKLNVWLTQSVHSGHWYQRKETQILTCKPAWNLLSFSHEGNGKLEATLMSINSWTDCSAAHTVDNYWATKKEEVTDADGKRSESPEGFAEHEHAQVRDSPRRTFLKWWGSNGERVGGFGR